MELACSILATCLKKSARIAEEMENNNLLELFGFILKSKANLLTIPIFEILLDICGKNVGFAGKAVIYNEEAYRYLFLDFELLNLLSKEVAFYHFAQFRLFLIDSEFREANMLTLQKLCKILKF